MMIPNLTCTSQRRAAVLVTFSLWLSATTISGFAPRLAAPGWTSLRSATLHSSSQLYTQQQDHDQIQPDELSYKNLNTASNGEKPAVPKKQQQQSSSMMTRMMMGPQQLAAAAALATILAVAPPADAAMSGGRMGGSFSPSRSSGGGMTRMAPSSRSFGGGGGGYYGGGSRTTIIAPYFAPSPFITPFYNPIIPFGGGVGAISYSRGPGLFDLLFLGGLGFFVLSTATSILGNSRNINQWDEGTSVFSSTGTSTALGTGTSVLQLSVAVDVPNRDDPYSLLSVLDRLAQSSNTGSRKGVQNLTSQVAMELLRRKSSIQAAASRYQHVKKESEGQRLFNQWSVQERSKFEQETVSKFGGIDVSPSALGRRSSGGDVSDSKATMAVVTLVLSIQGDSTKVSKIRSLADVEDALRRIAADVKIDDCLTGAEILWTPQDRSETLSRRDVVADYPELTTV